MVGVIVAMAVVIVAFFVAGIVFGVAWIYLMSNRRARTRQRPHADQAPEYETLPYRR